MEDLYPWHMPSLGDQLSLPAWDFQQITTPDLCGFSESANGGISAVAFPLVCILTGSVFFAKLANFTEIITNYKTDLYLRIPRHKHLHCKCLKLGRLNPIQTGHARLLP